MRDKKINSRFLASSYAQSEGEEEKERSFRSPTWLSLNWREQILLSNFIPPIRLHTEILSIATLSESKKIKKQRNQVRNEFYCRNTFKRLNFPSQAKFINEKFIQNPAFQLNHVI